MADYEKRQLVAWVFTAALTILLVLSVTGDGTWLGGMGTAWLMAITALLFIGGLYFAYRFGRLDKTVEQPQEHPKR